MRVAVLDDWQSVAREAADWSPLSRRADVVFFERPFGGPGEAAQALAGFEILIAMRERTAFPRSLIDRLPKLRMIALTGSRTWTMDIDACTARGIVVCNTGGEKSGAATAELALALLLAAARSIPAATAKLSAIDHTGRNATVKEREYSGRRPIDFRYQEDL